MNQQTIKDSYLFVQVLSALAGGDQLHLQYLNDVNEAGYGRNLVGYLYKTFCELELLELHRNTLDGYNEVDHSRLGKLQWRLSTEGTNNCRVMEVRLNGSHIIAATAADSASPTFTTWCGPNSPVLSDHDSIELLGHL